MTKLQKVWARGKWPMYEYIANRWHNVMDWQLGWGWLGLVPAEVRLWEAAESRADMAAIKSTVGILAEEACLFITTSHAITGPSSPIECPLLCVYALLLEDSSQRASARPARAFSPRRGGGPPGAHPASNRCPLVAGRGCAGPRSGNPRHNSLYASCASGTYDPRHDDERYER